MVASSKAAARAAAPRPPPFHELELARGWRLLRARAQLTADPRSRLLRGAAQLDVAALSTRCTGVGLHLRGASVESVAVDGAPAPWALTDPVAAPATLAAVAVGGDGARPRVDAVRGAAEALRPALDPPELHVALPASVSADVCDRLDALAEAAGGAGANAAALAATAANSAGLLSPPVSDVRELPSFTVSVEWVVRDGSAAAVFSADPAVLVVDGRVGRARNWIPCVDTVNWCDRCLWDIVLSVPPDMTAVCSGELLETRIVTASSELEEEELGAGHATKSSALVGGALVGGAGGPVGSTCGDGNGQATRAGSRFRDRRRPSVERVGVISTAAAAATAAEPALPAKRYTYRLTSATHAGEIAFVVGVFLPLADQETPTAVTHFCLPGRSRDLVHTVPFVFSQARAFCRDYFNADLPGASLKQVFAGDGIVDARPNCAAGGLIVYPASLLHNARCIDEGFTARIAITTAVVSSYIGVMVRPQKPEDAWFVAGLAEHVSALALKSILGKNWYRVHVNDLVRAMAEASGDDAPMLQEIQKDPMFCVENAGPAVRRRAHLIAYIIERRVGADVLRRALREVVADKNRAEAGANPHDEALLGLNCGPFLKRVRAICGTDIRNLVKSWAASRGAPRMRFGYRYNGRRHQTEFAIEQKATGHAETLSRGREGLLFQGPLCVRVMEPEGSFDHTVEVIDPVFVADLSCHCRRTKQKPVTQAEKDAGEEPARIAPISWVRVDPDMEWCVDVSFVQPETAWIAMLQGERDAVAQINACRGLVEYGTEAGAKALAECLANTELYWRVRAEAVESMAMCKGGLPLLLAYFRHAYCVSDSEAATPSVEALQSANGTGKRVVARKSAASDTPEKEVDARLSSGEDGKMEGLEANDFSDIGEYMVRRTIIRTVAGVCEKPRGQDIGPAVDFIFGLLSDNDNSRNPFDEDHYLVDLIQSAAKVAVARMSDGKDTSSRILDLLRRVRLLDRMTPSRSGAVGAALVLAFAEIERARLVLADRESSKSNMGVEPVITAMLKCRLAPNTDIMRQILELARPGLPLISRSAAFHALAGLYSGDLETVLWLLSRVDRTATGDDALIVPENGAESADECCVVVSPVEAPCVRYAALSALLEASRVKTWKKQAPILMALRRHTKRAMQICGRIFRLAIGDGDELVRFRAVELAEAVWGHGVPACLLNDSEFRAEVERARQMRLRNERMKVEQAEEVAKAAARGPDVSRKPSKGSTSSKDGVLRGGSVAGQFPRPHMRSVPVGQSKKKPSTSTGTNFISKPLPSKVSKGKPDKTNGDASGGGIGLGGGGGTGVVSGITAKALPAKVKKVKTDSRNDPASIDLTKDADGAVATGANILLKAGGASEIKSHGSSRERTPTLGVLTIAPKSEPPRPLRDVDLKVTAEDRDYLLKAYKEDQADKERRRKSREKAAAARQRNAAAAVEGGAPPVGFSVDRGGTGDVEPVPEPHSPEQVPVAGSLVTPVVDLIGASAENEERRKERRKKKKKKRRREEGEGVGELGEEFDEDGNRKKKKKKKKKRHRLEGGEFEGDAHRTGEGAAGGTRPGLNGNGVPTSEGSIRSDGQGGSLKVKISMNGLSSAQIQRD